MRSKVMNNCRYVYEVFIEKIMEFTEFITQRSKLLPSLPNKKKKKDNSKIRLSVSGKFKLVFLPNME